MGKMADQHVLLESYRPDIDGLRAFAVISVLLFHAGFTTFGGGFIGVDIFFVISGYLITGILIKDTEQNKFNFLKFISRRFFRLYPSLIFVVFVSVLLGFLLFSPDHFKELGRSAVSSLLSISNYDYFQRAGYFTESSASNPLLHTWSLGVEQQFYLIYPLVLVAAYKASKKLAIFLVLLVGTLSLFSSQHYVSSDASLAYFSTISRGFEFAVGASLHWMPKKKIKNFLLEIFLATGILGLVFCVFYFNKHTSFPGFYALIPCLFAGLCIYAGEAKYTGWVLRNKVMVWIGLISYSLYLVHWPMITFYTYYIYSVPSVIEKVLFVIFPFVFAYPLYVFVENKFRRVSFSDIGGMKFLSLAFVSLFTVSISLYAYFSSGMHWRLDEKALDRIVKSAEYHKNNYGGANFPPNRLQFLGDLESKQVSYILIGDSFAGHLTAGLDSLLKENKLKAVAVWSSGCFIGDKYVSSRNGSPIVECLAASKLAMDMVSQYNAKIIYAESWGAYRAIISSKDGTAVSLPERSDYYKVIVSNIKNILDIAGSDRELIIFGSPPGDGSTKGLSLKSCLERPPYIPSYCQENLVFPETEGLAFSENIGINESISKMKNVHFINPYDFFCSAGKCRALVDSEIVYSDYAHLSISGSKKLVEFFSNEVLK